GAGCGSPPPAEPIKVEPIRPATEAPQEPSSEPMNETSASTSTEERLAFPGVLPGERIEGKIVRITTDVGEIVFEILPEEGPKAASNFVYLAEKGFYDGLVFHRVESWVIQGGDPLGKGIGGPGYRFEDDPVRLPYVKGIVAMANSGPNTNGSQFFIMKEQVPLPPSYSIFGRVLSGLDVVDKVAIGTKMLSVTVEDKE
ncbi:peptidylprolyl isomerase, partial [Candidatus Uhrbacteria bacterium]|nr:peptidylprolyl isomerase [Candidatus Uhrbacteria bacterium]